MQIAQVAPLTEAVPPKLLLAGAIRDALNDLPGVIESVRMTGDDASRRDFVAASLMDECRKVFEARTQGPALISPTRVVQFDCYCMTGLGSV